MTDNPFASFGQREAMSPLEYIDLALSGKIPPSEQMVEIIRKRQQVGKQAARLLEPEMREFLETLLDRTLRSPMLPREIPAADRLDYVARREGENAIVWEMLNLIAAGRDEQPPKRGDV